MYALTKVLARSCNFPDSHTAARELPFSFFLLLSFFSPASLPLFSPRDPLSLAASLSPSFSLFRRAMHMIIVVGVSTETDNPLMHDVCVDLFPCPLLHPTLPPSPALLVRPCTRIFRPCAVRRVFYTRSFDISRVGGGCPIMASAHPLPCRRHRY